MKTCSALVVLLIIFCFSQQALGQNVNRQQQEDSLTNIIQSSKDDTLRCQAYRTLAGFYIYTDPDTVLGMMDRSNAIANSLINNNHQKTDLHALGLHWLSTGLIMKAICFQIKSNYPAALDFYLEALKVIERLAVFPNERFVNLTAKKESTINGNLGALYFRLENFEKANYYTKKTIAYRQKINDLQGVATNLNNLGNQFREMGMIGSADSCYRYILTLDTNKINVLNRASAHLNLGINHQNGGSHDSAIYYCKMAVGLYKRGDDYHNLTSAITNLGIEYINVGQLDKAEMYLLQAFDLAKKVKKMLWIASVHEHMARLYSRKKDFEKAFYHERQHRLYRDSLKNEERTSEITRLEVESEYDKKMLADSVQFQAQIATKESQLKLKDERILKEEAEHEKEKTIRYSLFGGLGLILIFAVFIFNRFQVTRKQKVEIEKQKKKVDEKNKDITDSINYAQRIQEAMLPLESNIHKAFADSFVLYKPRDIVSGDFYWFRNYGDAVVVSVADCTGHGVPGAFMSMMGSELLNQVISEPDVRTPAQALTLIDQRITQQLNKEGREERQDGMDMVLAVYLPEKNILQFCGANNPLVMIRDNDLTMIKPNKQGVGGAKSDTQPFEYQEIQTQLGDCFYMFSDGYQDQFGGPKGKKFMRKRMHQIMLDNHQLPMSKQKEILEKAFMDWKGNHEQIDDVCMIGIKI